VDKLEKQVSQLPKKDLSKGQSQSLFWLKEVLEMNTSLALFLSFSLFVSPKNLLKFRNLYLHSYSRERFNYSYIATFATSIDILQH
jgi:hypothetical protein